MPEVSIIIPFYNCPYVDQAVQSALNQTYEDIEVIIVNDGSNQHMQIMEPYMDRIKYIEKEHGGTASALNRGIKESSGKYICWLSSDDIFFKDKTKLQLDFMAKNDVRVSCTNYHLINYQSKVLKQYAGTPFYDKQDFYRIFLEGKNPINGSTVMIKKELLYRVGLFNEQLKFIQDFDMWIRILETENIYYLNDALVLYRIHNQMGTRKNKERSLREKDYLINKYEKLIKEKLKYKKRLR